MSRGIAVVTFPGSNGDHDALDSLRDGVGVPAELVDYRETDLTGFDAVVVPGGFSYGDYLRCGAIARFAPVMEPLKAFADRAESDAAALSTRRAEVVVDWLAARGIERNRLNPKGCDARRPLDFGKTAEGRAMNRRAELVRFAPTAGCEPPW